MGTVLQYTLVYCSEKGMRMAVCIAIQTGCAGRGAGQALGSGGSARALGKEAGAGRGKGSRPGRAAGPIGCALGALGLFLTRFDSVLFMSQFLDIVHKLGS